VASLDPSAWPDDPLVAAIRGQGRRRRLAAGETLFRQGQPGDNAFLLLEGELQVLVAVGALDVAVALLRPGQLVGEIAVFAGQPRIATVTARTPCRIAALPRAALLALVAANSTAAAGIIADLGRRLAAVNQPLAFLAGASRLLQDDQVDGDALATLLAAERHSLGPFADNLAMMLREVAAKQERRQDMQTAWQIQQSALPGRLPEDMPEVTMAARIRPTKEVGGDLYDWFRVGPRQLAVAVADVSGKGVPAALFMMMFHSVLRAVARPGLTPGEMLVRANDILGENNEACMFVTVWLGLLDLDSGRLDYVNAGHNPPYLVAADGRCRCLPSDGAAIALLPTVAYPARTVAMAAGDLLFLFSDGVTEAFDAHGAQFGEPRLEQLLLGQRRQPVAALVDAVIASVDDFARGRDQADDITCLAMRWHEPT
jgi:sigma-B regulation protein RsbU (phosphoserine phosphatase)